MELKMTHVPKVDLQLLGGILSPLSFFLPSCQMYQSRLALSLELRLSVNQSCCRSQRHVNRSEYGHNGRETHLVRAVVDHEIHDELHAPLMTGILDLLPVVQGTVTRVDILVVRDVVAHVGLRRLVHWREPDDIDAELVQVGDLGQDTLERPVAVRGVVREGSLRDVSAVYDVRVMMGRERTG